MAKFKMTIAATLEIQMHATKWEIIATFRSNFVHRLRKTCSLQKSPKRKYMANLKMAAVAILEIQVPARKWAIIGQFR
jgi:hypothetical protein